MGPTPTATPRVLYVNDYDPLEKRPLLREPSRYKPQGGAEPDARQRRDWRAGAKRKGR